MPDRDAIRKRRERREARQNAADEAKAQEQQQKSDAKDYRNGMPFSSSGRGASIGSMSMQYPQDLFAENQKNGVAFYVVSKQKIGGGASNRGVDLSGKAREAAIAYQKDFLSNGENAGGNNRVSNERTTAVAVGAAGLGALMVGAATLKGVGVSSFTKFITKAGKTALATGAGAAGAALLTSKFGGLFTNNQSEFTTQGIYLHVPQSVITAYQANWDETNLGLAGRLGSEQDFSLASVGEAGGVLAKGLIGGAATLPSAVGIGNADFAGAFEATSRIANNPYKEQLFRSMGFRKFSFNYTFSPKNSTEIKSVEDIIKTFKFHMHPDMSPETVFLQYPSEFIIEFLYAEGDDVKRNENLPRIGSCALTNVKVSYGPDGYMNTIKGTGGKPSEINMELAFTELEVLTGAHIEAGF